MKVFSSGKIIRGRARGQPRGSVDRVELRVMIATISRGLLDICAVQLLLEVFEVEVSMVLEFLEFEAALNIDP